MRITCPAATLFLLLCLMSCRNDCPETTLYDQIQGGWYRVFASDTIEILFFEDRVLRQYFNSGLCVEYYQWVYSLDSDGLLWKGNDTLKMLVGSMELAGDTLTIDKGGMTNGFLPHDATALPAGWPDCIVEMDIDSIMERY